MPPGVGGGGAGSDGAIGVWAGFGTRFFSLRSLGRLRLLHRLLLARRAAAICLLGFLCHLQSPESGLTKIMQHGITP